MKTYTHTQTMLDYENKLFENEHITRSCKEYCLFICFCYYFALNQILMFQFIYEAGVF